MVSSWVVGLTSILLSFTSVAATGGFPLSSSAPGSCNWFPSDASCSAVFQACVNTLQNKADPYSNEACVAAASCYPTNPDLFLSHLFCRVQGPNSTAPKSADIPRVSESIIGKMLVRGEFASSKSYTTWYNNVVASVTPNATVLIDPAFVKMNFDIMLAWTGFCSNGEILPNNLGDWFQWFSTVTGPATTCNLVTNCPISFQPYVIDLTVTCAREQNSISNQFSIQPCVAAALNWEAGIDSFLQALTCRYNILNGSNVGVPASNDLPTLSFYLLVSNTPPYTQQNFLLFTYLSVSAIGTSFHRYPVSFDVVYSRWGSYCAMDQLLLYAHCASAKPIESPAVLTCCP